MRFLATHWIVHGDFNNQLLQVDRHTGVGRGAAISTSKTIGTRCDANESMCRV